MTAVGGEVRIIEDCRDGGPATGQTGIYEGRFPIPGHEGYPDNPRIRLADGSKIWGAECWWEDATDDMAALEESQERVDEYRAKFAHALDGLYDAVMHSVRVNLLGRRRKRFLLWQRKQIRLNLVQRASRLVRLRADAERLGYERDQADDLVDVEDYL